MSFTKISSNWALSSFIKSFPKIHSIHLIFTYQCTKFPATVWEGAFIHLSLVAGLYVVNEVPFLIIESSQNETKLVDKKCNKQKTFIM